MRSPQMPAGLGQSLEPETADQEKEETFPGFLIHPKSQAILSLLQTSIMILVWPQGLGLRLPSA